MVPTSSTHPSFRCRCWTRPLTTRPPLWTVVEAAWSGRARGGPPHGRGPGAGDDAGPPSPAPGMWGTRAPDGPAPGRGSGTPEARPGTAGEPAGHFVAPSSRARGGRGRVGARALELRAVGTGLPLEGPGPPRPRRSVRRRVESELGAAVTVPPATRGGSGLASPPRPQGGRAPSVAGGGAAEVGARRGLRPDRRPGPARHPAEGWRRCGGAPRRPWPRRRLRSRRTHPAGATARAGPRLSGGGCRPARTRVCSRGAVGVAPW
jgi:hypothetical protein